MKPKNKKNKTIRELAREAFETIGLSELPKQPSDQKKRQRIVGSRKKATKFLFCPAVYALIKKWCIISRQYLGTFIQNAVIDAFIKEVGTHDDRVKILEKYFMDYFGKHCSDDEVELSAEEEEEEGDEEKA